MYEAQRESRKRKLAEGWKRVEAFLDPETAAEWQRLAAAEGGPTALVKAMMAAFKSAKAKRAR